MKRPVCLVWVCVEQTHTAVNSMCDQHPQIARTNNEVGKASNAASIRAADFASRMQVQHVTQRRSSRQIPGAGDDT